MTKKKIPNQQYKKMLREIRPYVSFNYNLSKKLAPAQKAKITKYWREISALKARPNYIFRPRNKKNLTLAQEFAQHDPGYKQIKVAFVPVGGEREKPKLTFKKGKVTARYKYMSESLIPLNTKKLARLVDKKPEQFQQEILDTIAPYPEYKTYTIAAGKYEIPRALTKETVGKEVAKLMLKYRNKKANNYHGNWLHSLRGYTLHGQVRGKYFKEKQQAKKDLQRQRKNSKKNQTKKTFKDASNARNSGGRL